MSKGALVALLSLLLACQSGGGRERAAATADAGTTGPSIKVIGKGDRNVLPPPSAPLPRQTGFELVDAGAEPRARRFYTLTAPAERTLTAELTITSRTLRDSVWTERMQLPLITQALAVLPEPTAAGVFRLRLRAIPAVIAEGGSDAARDIARLQTERWRSHLERRRVDASLDDRGAITALGFADLPGETGAPSPQPDPARDELWQYLLGLAVPMPEQPIGVGARWKVTTLLRAGTATVTQTADYQLTAIDGDRWTVTLTARRIGERQQIEPGALPRDSRIELIGLFREVTGTVTLSQADPLPVAGTLRFEVRTHARFTIPGEPMVEVASEDVGTVSLK